MEVFLHKDAEKYLDRLNMKDQNRINDAIEKLRKEPPEGDIESLTGQNGFRTRVGNYRLLWRINGTVILVTHIDPRGQVYKKKNKGNKR
ncbi:MAG: type II toxin-antitoxin system RelE/ParE family toxin [Treponema sp.]|nr:type II toxin-antitoxin system RelE/ParE family toxin [Treponema sp.]